MTYKDKASYASSPRCTGRAPNDSKQKRVYAQKAHSSRGMGVMRKQGKKFTLKKQRTPRSYGRSFTRTAKTKQKHTRKKTCTMYIHRRPPYCTGGAWTLEEKPQQKKSPVICIYTEDHSIVRAELQMEATDLHHSAPFPFEIVFCIYTYYFCIYSVYIQIYSNGGHWFAP